MNHDTLEQQIIIDDPKVYTKPWVSPPKLHKLEPGWEIAEWFCVLDENKDYDQVVRKLCPALRLDRAQKSRHLYVMIQRSPRVMKIEQGNEFTNVI